MIYINNSSHFIGYKLKSAFELCARLQAISEITHLIYHCL